MFSDIIFAFIIIIYLSFITYKGYLINFLPSSAWLTFMLTPFIQSSQYFEDTQNQKIGIITFQLAFFAGDLISLKYGKKYISAGKRENSLLIITVGIPVFLVPIVHLLLVGKIPLYSYFFEGTTVLEFQQDRYDFSRGGIPFWFGFLANWTISIFGVLVIAHLLFKRKYLLTSFLIIWIGIYTLFSGAKGNLAIFLFSILALFCIIGSIKLKVLSNFIICFSFCLIIVSGIILSEKAISGIEKCPVPYGANPSPANILRSCSAGNEISLNPMVDTLGYRVFLTPVEVSNNWYNYYSNASVNKRTFLEVIQRQDNKKAANLIAQEFYAKYWPENYSSLTQANSSIDADAFSIGGLLFVFLFAIIIFFSRILISALKYDDIFSNSLYIVGTVSLSLLPFSSSIQAIFVPWGFGLIVFMMIFNKFLYKNQIRFISRPN